MFWRTWREKERLMAPLYAHPDCSFYAPGLQFEELRAVETARGPRLQPYEGLCEMWDGYARRWMADYPDYLLSLARRCRFRLDSVLDLACGTGLLTERLAAVADEVVGLDASEPMLAKARARASKRANVTFARGDLRDFRLDQQFDAAVCSSNSMNYLAVPDELTAALRCVAEHLRRGGVFVFDTITELGMKWTAGQYLHATSDGRRFAIRMGYDPGRRQRDEAMVILPGGIEVHRQYPIDPFEVKAAARDAGLVMSDAFSSPCLTRSWNNDGMCFFVLTKR